MDNMRLDPASSEPARQPEAVAASLIGQRDPTDRPASTPRFVPPPLDQSQQCRRIRLVWGFVCQGGINPFLSSFVIPFFCSTCAASILSSRPHICIAVAHSGGQGRRFFSAAEGLSLTDASTAAGC